ncbi:MAG: penicillin acylase family protein, partial [Phycisphaerales bacterium]
DMSGLDSNSVVLVGGQDGDLASPHFLDQVDLWRRGDMIPLPLSAEGQRARTVLTVRLSPAPGGRAGD